MEVPTSLPLGPCCNQNWTMASTAIATNARGMILVVNEISLRIS